MKSEVGSRNSELGSRNSELGSRNLELGSRKLEVGTKKSEISSPYPAFVINNCYLMVFVYKFNSNRIISHILKHTHNTLQKNAFPFVFLDTISSLS